MSVAAKMAALLVWLSAGQVWAQGGAGAPGGGQPAGDARVALRWQPGVGGEECGDPLSFAGGVEALLSRPVFAPRYLTELHVVVEISASPGWQARVELLRGGRGQGPRILQSPGACEALLRAAALAVSMLVDEAAPGPVAESPTVSAPASQVRPPPEPPPPGLPEERAPSWGPSLGLGAALGRAPGVLPVLQAGLEWPRGRWLGRAWLEGGAFRDRVRGGTTVSTQRLGLGSDLCARLGSAWRLGACVHLQVGGLRASGEGFERDTASWRATLEAGPGVLLEAPPTPWGTLALQVDLGLPTRRYSFQYLDTRGAQLERYRLAAWSLAARLRLSLPWAS